MSNRFVRGAAAVAIAAMLAPTDASATDLWMTTVLWNELTHEVRGGVQNVQFKTIPANDGVTVWPTIGVSLFTSTHAAYRADFEGMDGPSTHYCEIHIQTWAEHTFFGGTKATGCKAEVKSTMAGYICEAYASTPSSAGCSFSLKLRK